jgi:hypothetical protein
MKKACIVILLFLSWAFLSSISIPLASAQSQAAILPNHSGYLDNRTIPITYHVVGEVINIGTVGLTLLNVSVRFYAQNNSLIGSSSSYALLDVLLPSRKAPFEAVWAGSSANQIRNYSLSLEFSEYTEERPVTLQTLQNTVYTDEVGFLKVNGTIRNLAISNATTVKVIAPFYDSQGKVLGIARGYTSPSTIMPNQAESFEIELPRKVSSFANYSVSAESAEYEAIGTQVTVNYGATYTNTTLVTLILTSSDPQSSVAQMRFSNDNRTFTNWEPYTALRSWTLLGGDGVKTVYAQFIDISDSISPLYFDTIVLDTTLPTITITYPTNSSAIAFSTITVNWTGFDATSGINGYEARLDSSLWVKVKTNTTQTFTNLTDGQHTVYIKATDKAGLSNQESVSFTVNTNPSKATSLEAAIAIVAVILVAGVLVYLVKIRKRSRRRSSKP